MHRVLERFRRGLVVSDEEIVFAEDLNAVDEVVGFEGVDDFVIVVWVEDGIWEALVRGIFDVEDDGTVAGVDVGPGCVGAFESVFIPKAVEEARVEGLGSQGAQADCMGFVSAIRCY